MAEPEKIAIAVNGNEQIVVAGCSVEDLLLELFPKIQRSENKSSNQFGAIAVELNSEIVPHSQFSQSVLKSGDSVEVVTLVGGG